MPVAAVMTGGLAGAAVLVGAGWAASTYPGLLRLRGLVQESWRQLDLELGRRHDLVPDLVSALGPGASATVREAAAGVLAALGAAREVGCPIGRRAGRELALGVALDRLFALAGDGGAEGAGEGFASLRGELEAIHDSIAAGARWYNNSVGELDGRIARFPRGPLARLSGIRSVQAFRPQAGDAAAPVAAG